jgi:growth hormone-inducible transmembrane protein
MLGMGCAGLIGISVA